MAMYISTPKMRLSLGTPEALCGWLARFPPGDGLQPASDGEAVDIVPRAVEHAMRLGYVRGDLDGEPLRAWDPEALYLLTPLGLAFVRWGSARVFGPA